MKCVPESELQNRVLRLQKLLAAEAVDAALITQNADLLYFTGTVNRAYLYVPVMGEPVLFVARGAERMRSETNIRHVVDLRQLREIPAELKNMGYHLPERLGMESDVLPANPVFFAMNQFFSTSLFDGCQQHD